MRLRVSLLAVQCLLIGAIGWVYPPTLIFPLDGGGSMLKRPRTSRLLLLQRDEQQLQHQRGLRGLRLLHTIMTAAADSGADGPGKNYNKAAWQRRARRAMKYVSMPIVNTPGQPREQLMVALPFPAANKTINFVFDTLRRKTLVTPAARDALGVLDGPESGLGSGSRGGGRPDLGASVELPAARIGHEWGDHFRVAMDAVVANYEELKVLGPTTGGVLGLDFLARYDLDLNFEEKEVRFYVAGAVDQGLVDTSWLEGLACGYLPGGKLGIKMELNGGGAFTGVLDLASNSTVGNWLAARDLDVTSMAQGQASSYPRETGRSRPLMCAHFDTIQLGHVLLTSVVDAKSAREGRLAVYVGHLPEFESIAKDISSEPRGRQLALVGQDLITHTRVVLSCRSKRLFFAPLEENDVWAGQVI